MSRPRIPVRFTGQHFTINKQLIFDALHLADINHNDTVIDIGAGKGHLTLHLSLMCRKVIAIEKDRSLASHLEKRFMDNNNVDIFRYDVRNFDFPEITFKTVSNIPYGITSDVFKTLMYQYANQFSGGTIITQFDAAEKLFSEDLYNPYIILYRTFFDLNLIYEVHPDSFIPPPTVMSALLQIRKKKQPKIHISLRKKYLSFLFCLLKKPEMPARTALKRLFRKRQVNEIFVNYGIDPNLKITRLSPEDWAHCFSTLLEKVPNKYHPK